LVKRTLDLYYNIRDNNHPDLFDFFQDLFSLITMRLYEFAVEVHKRLLNVYGVPVLTNNYSPIDQLISTILSQNTNDRNRDTAFISLKQRYPSWIDVRDAKENEVIDSIRTAGLANQKGKRIQEILRQITELRGDINLDFLGEMPVEEARQWLLNFKGVGPKTAAIILLFSFGKPAFPVDTHVFRITKRLGLIPMNMTVERAHSHLENIFPEESYYSLHLNLVRLGREVCHARNPDCSRCPLDNLCEFFKARPGNSKK